MRDAPSSPQAADAAPAPGAGSAPQHCLNCDAALHGPYCSQCGQRNADIAVSLTELGREAAEEYLSVDSRLFRSVLALFFRPGYLTRQYLIGRRERYVRPLRLYLVSSIVFFFVFSIVLRPSIGFGTEGDMRMRDIFLSEQAEQAEQAADAVEAPGDTLSEGTAPADTLAGAERSAPPQAPSIGDLGLGGLELAGWNISFEERVERLSQMTPRELLDAFFTGLERHLPRMMFLLLPVFALLLKLLNLRRPWYYAEHFIFTLHLHAFAFALFLLLLVLPIGGWRGLLVLWGAVYLFVAMLHVYRQTFLKTVMKYMILTTTYTVLLTIAVTGSILVTLLFV